MGKYTLKKEFTKAEIKIKTVTLRTFVRTKIKILEMKTFITMVEF